MLWIQELLAGQHQGIGSFRLAACDALFDLHGLLAVRHAERAAEHRHVFGQTWPAGEVAGQDVAGLQVESSCCMVTLPRPSTVVSSTSASSISS